MHSLRRLLFVLLAAIAAAPSAVHAAPLVVGQVSAFDYTSFGPDVSVFNDTDLVPDLAPGDVFTALSLALFDEAGVTLASYDLDVLLPGFPGWNPTASGPVVDYGAVSRITVSTVFRKQTLTASLRSCQPGDLSDGCLTESLIPLRDGVDCAVTPDECEAIRSGGAVLTYVPPVVVPEPASLGVIVALGLIALVRRNARL